jgi:sarcosine oxidase subunit alpha
MSSSAEAVTFTFDGQSITAGPGQTIAGALHEAGVHVLSRSFKYHRPRGLFCATGRCPNCLCTVDGDPNVRTCVTEATRGATVRSQNAWPSLRFDMLGILDRLHRFMPVGFYYRVMHKPRFLWPVFESIVRRIAGLGRVDRESGGRRRYDRQTLHSDVVVIGGGWAGLHAAIEASRRGRDVTLVDDRDALGGHLLENPAEQVELDAKFESTVRLVLDDPRIRVLQRATAFGCYEDRLVAVQTGNRLIRLRAGQVVVATGGWEQPLVFPGNDRPGVMLASGVQRMLWRDGCSFPGTAVVVTDNESGYQVAHALEAAGTRVAAVLDHNSTPAGHVGTLPVRSSQTIHSVRGRRHVTAAVVGPIEGSSSAGEVIPCNWVIEAVGFTTASGLLAQAGCRLVYDESRDLFRADQLVEGYRAAGSVNGTFGVDACAREGRLAGEVAAAGAGGGAIEVSPAERPSAPRRLPEGKKAFVCLCEDVTEGDLFDAVADGFSNIETLKRYSTVCMGPCQGKMCQAGSIAACARANGATISETGRTTARPPDQPVPLGVLAGRAPHRHLYRLTALHDWHIEAGAVFMDSGAWKRPESYGDASAEYQAVRDGVGLIDVSTLGKLELRGPDVAEFLEFVYPNRFAKLPIGKVRYGVICDESGIILDDGTIARLEEDRWFVTTTSGNAEGVDSWFRWWLATRPDWDICLTNISGATAAMNLAGPLSREVLERVCDGDLSTESMPYLAARQMDVAGVGAILLRIGFVGELGYEIHVPTHLAEHVWSELMSAGAAAGIRPFGVEAQRRLRLDKQHLLAGQDTDALSNPLDAGLPWIVKLDKPDFVGREALKRASGREPGQQLVGFRLEGKQVPPEPSLVLVDGRLEGRVTSARYSPVAGATVGLAWVPAELSENGREVSIQIDGQLVNAVVQREPFYDPDGARLRS